MPIGQLNDLPLPLPCKQVPAEMPFGLPGLCIGSLAGLLSTNSGLDWTLACSNYPRSLPNHFNTRIYVQWHQQRYSQSHRTACHRTKRSLGVVPAGGSHWQPMDTFLFHRNYTRQTSGMAVNHEAAGFVNSAVTALFTKLPVSRFTAIQLVCLV